MRLGSCLCKVALPSAAAKDNFAEEEADRRGGCEGGAVRKLSALETVDRGAARLDKKLGEATSFVEAADVIVEAESSSERPEDEVYEWTIPACMADEACKDSVDGVMIREMGAGALLPLESCLDPTTLSSSSMYVVRIEESLRLRGRRPIFGVSELW